MHHRYAAILGNLGNTRDRFCPGYKDNPSPAQMLQRAAAIPQVNGIELVGTWDLRPDNLHEMSARLSDLDLACVSIIPDLFTEPKYAKGSLSSTDPSVRDQALDHCRHMCDLAGQLRCGLLNIWPGQDGYDYLLASDYAQERELLCQAITDLATRNPDTRFALEYKPKEPRTHSHLARLGDTLLLALETGCSNVGVTIDTGHAFLAGEVLGEAIMLAHRTGDRLFHMHFNDNHTTTDDDMIVGSVHSIAYLEALYWLERCGYSGWLSMDQYPYREDAADAIAESILWLEHYARLVHRHRDELDQLISQRDGVASSRFLRSALAPCLADPNSTATVRERKSQPS